VGADEERLDLLDGFTGRISRLLVGQYELLRTRVEDEVAVHKPASVRSLRPWQPAAALFLSGS
jgi:hypothetical protein